MELKREVFVWRSKKKLCCSYISVFSYCCHHIQWMISNSSGKPGLFFRGWSDGGTVVRERDRARRARSRGRMDPRGLQDRGPGEPPRNAEPGDSPRTGPRAAMPPSVHSGRVLEARSLLRAGELPPAARLLPASLAGDCGGTPRAAAKSKWGGSTLFRLGVRNQGSRPAT